MSKGRAIVKHVGKEGVIGYETASQYDFLYTTSVIKDPEYDIGDRVVLADGRVFRYAKATNIISATQFGLKFWGQLDDGIDYTAPIQTELATARQLTVDAGAEGDYVVDELKGGYIIIHTHSVNNHITRGIIGNTASDGDGNVTIYVDAPWGVVIAVAYGVETCPNPYASVRVKQASHGGGGDRYSSVAGMPAVKTTVANQYLWLQTWGPCWVNPQGDVAHVAAVDRRGLLFDYEGSITQVDVSDATAKKMQYAGFIITRDDSGGTGPPLIMLQISS